MDAIRAFLDRCLAESHDFGPIPAWWWSGEKLAIHRMRWQMDQMHAMGIRQFVVINLAPSGTMFCSDPDDPPYMSEAWWTIFGQVCDYAREIGMKVWFYDQIGFSGASYQADIATEHPEFLAQQLRRVSVKGTGELAVRSPDAGNPLRAYVADEYGNIARVPITNGIASSRSDAPVTLHLIYTIAQGYDLLSRDACETLLDTVHRQFEKRLPQHLCSTIVGSFQDELPDLPTWGTTFAGTFAARFGYRIEDRIEHLFDAGSDDAKRTRVHYHMHRASLAEEAFFKPFYEWHESHGLRCGFDQQSPAREARVVGAIEKYADYMQTHKWYACPGSDLHGNGKLHASLAFLHQRPRVWLEGFHSTGWGGTIADTFDWMLPYLQQGVTLYNAHAIYYGTSKGWWEWAPPSTCWRQPYAKHYKPFSEMIERLFSVLSRGIQQASVGVLFPTATVQSAVGIGTAFDEAKRADATLHELIGSVRWHQVKTGVLDSIPIDYLVLDEPSITNSTGKGTITIHGVPIRTLVLPAVTVLHDATVRRLIQFGRSGGTIICVGSSVIRTVEGATIELCSDANAIVIESADRLSDLLRDTTQCIRSDLPSLYRKDGDTHLVFIPASHGMATIVKWDSWFAPLERATIDPSRYARSATISLPDNARSVWKWDPQTNDLTQLHRPSSGDLGIDFAGSPFAVLLWNTASPALHDDSILIAARSTSVPLSDEWMLTFEPTLPTEYADVFDEMRDYLRWPRTSVFQWTNHSTGESKPVRATFGPRVRATTSAGIEKLFEYSPCFGIERDSLHQHSLGPKAHVPEEFLDLGKLTSGESATVQFEIHSDAPRSVHLVLSGNALKSLVLNNASISFEGKSYRQFAACDLITGLNRFELKFVAERAGNVRASWCFVESNSIEVMRVPDRLIAPDPAQLGTTVRFAKRFDLSSPIDSFAIKISTAAVATLFVDGAPIARLGGFDPYRLQPRGMVYHVPLAVGSHELAVEVQDTGSSVPILVDGLGIDGTGQRLALMSDDTWTVSRNGGTEQPAAIQLKQDVDGSAWHLFRRPHPLTQTAWLDAPTDQAKVLNLIPEPIANESVLQTFEWTMPPGATSMKLSLVRTTGVVIQIDVAPMLFDSDAINLPGSLAGSRSVKVTLHSRQLGGAVFQEPATYAFEHGTICLGEFAKQGLAEYSGAVRLRQTVACEPRKARKVSLDLGEVRGSVEAFINGTSAGICFVSPYRFDVTTLLKHGQNQIELVLANTLANHMAHWSPTRCIARDQLRFGVFGPVRIVYES